MRQLCFLRLKLDSVHAIDNLKICRRSEIHSYSWFPFTNLVLLHQCGQQIQPCNDLLTLICLRHSLNPCARYDTTSLWSSRSSRRTWKWKKQSVHFPKFETVEIFELEQMKVNFKDQEIFTTRKFSIEVSYHPVFSPDCISPHPLPFEFPENH